MHFVHLTKPYRYNILSVMVSLVCVLSCVTFFIEKYICFARKHVWKNLDYIVTFLLKSFRAAGYWKCSDETPSPVMIYVGLAETALRL